MSDRAPSPSSAPPTCADCGHLLTVGSIIGGPYCDNPDCHNRNAAVTWIPDRAAASSPSPALPWEQQAQSDSLADRAGYAASSIRSAVVGGKDDSDELAEWFNPGFLITTADIIGELLTALRSSASALAEAERRAETWKALATDGLGEAAREYLRCDDVGGNNPPPERARATQRARTRVREILERRATLAPETPEFAYWKERNTRGPR